VVSIDFILLIAGEISAFCELNGMCSTMAGNLVWMDFFWENSEFLYNKNRHIFQFLKHRNIAIFVDSKGSKKCNPPDSKASKNFTPDSKAR